MKTIYRTGNLYFIDFDEASKFGEAEQVHVFEDVAEWYNIKGRDMVDNHLNEIADSLYMALRMYFQKVLKS